MPLMCDIDLPFLSKYFHLPINDVAKEIGVCATVLKKICRKNGIPRWPHRKIKSIDKMISNLENTTPKNLEIDSRIKEEIETLRKKKAYLIKHPNILALGKQKRSSSTDPASSGGEEGNSDPTSGSAAYSLEPSSSPTPPFLNNKIVIAQPVIHNPYQLQVDQQPIPTSSPPTINNGGNSVPTSPNYFHSLTSAAVVYHNQQQQQQQQIQQQQIHHHQQQQQQQQYYQHQQQIHHHHHHHQKQQQYYHPHPHHPYQPPQQQQQIHQQQIVHKPPTPVWNHHQDSPFQTLKQVVADEPHYPVPVPVSPSSALSPPHCIDSQGCYSIQLPRLMIPSAFDEVNNNQKASHHLKTLEPTMFDVTTQPISPGTNHSHVQLALPSWFKKEHDAVLFNLIKQQQGIHNQQQSSSSPTPTSQSKKTNVTRVDQLISEEENYVPIHNIQFSSPSSLILDD